MKLILHPGHGKCGSTTIQKFLYSKRAALEEKGFAVPDMFLHFRFEKKCDFSIAQPAVYYLAEIIRQGNYHRLEDRIGEAIESAQKFGIHTFILSAENLSGTEAGPLHEVLSKHFEMIKVLYYIRRQDDFLLSAWQQWGHKSGNDFTEYCTRQLQHGHPLYRKNAEMLSSLYGTDILEVAPFARNVFHNEDLVTDFLVRTGLDADVCPEPLPSVENERLNPLVCDYLAQFPEIYETVHDNRPKISLEKYRLSEPWLFDRRKDYLSEAQRRSIMDHFEHENRKLHAAYFPKLSFELLFGVNSAHRPEDQTSAPKSLDKRQLRFLEGWVEKWLRTRRLRKFVIPKAKVILSMKRHLFRSR